jgi:hypothetical protein
MSVQDITKAALELPIKDREALGYTLLRSIGLDDSWDETDLPEEALEQRLSEMKDDPSKSAPLEEVFPELKAAIRQK